VRSKEGANQLKNIDVFLETIIEQGYRNGYLICQNMKEIDDDN